MLKNIIYTSYPTTIHSFLKWRNSNPKYNEIYKKIGCLLYDVSLRDGLQGLNKESQQNYSILKKIQIYNEINDNHLPKSIEYGSVVSPRVFPVFQDTIDIFKYIQQKQQKQQETNQEKEQQYHYVFIPNYVNFCKVLQDKYYENFSFISSASDQFLLKNIKQDFSQNFEDHKKIKTHCDFLFLSSKRKLYFSCVNECPIYGKMDNNDVVDKLLQLHALNFDNICLSDTCGTLEVNDFEFIVDKCHKLGINYGTFSLHLHVKQGRERIIEQIIHSALDRKIVKFDVSILDTGGCSVTIDKERLASNLSYELFYKSLVNYITKKVD